MRINAKIRGKVNRKLGSLATFHDTPGLALSAVLECLEPAGLTFGMIFQPKTGTTRSTFLQGEQEVSNSFLIVQTHEMPSGRVELTTYLS